MSAEQEVVDADAIVASDGVAQVNPERKACLARVQFSRTIRPDLREQVPVCGA
jgi:hypothetical protein